MPLSLLDSKGTPPDRQRFTWREMTPRPISKLDDDAFTRVRLILMNGIEGEALCFGHACSRMNRLLLIAELVDHEGWELLIELAQELHQEGLADDFRLALQREQVHRHWHEETVLSEAT